MSDCQKIINLAEKYLSADSFSIVNDVIIDPRFSVWSGSAKPEHHHYGNGGLAKHTFEVLNLCFMTKETLALEDLDNTELFFSALYHDVGKMYDYAPIGNGVDWQATEHKRMIHHISRSAIYWSHGVAKYPDFFNKYHDSVLHAILSHHGQREWGSPVAPKTKVAWLVHLCDGISARMDDWNKSDVLQR